MLATTSVYLIVFRVIHIMSAIAWGGSVFMFAVFLGPAAAELGPAAGPVMGNLVAKRKLTDVIIRIAAFTVLGGLFLYWHDAGGFSGLGDFVDSAYGFVLTIGALAGIGAFVVGLRVTLPSVKKLVAMGGAMAASGGVPTPDQMAEMKRLQGKMKAASRATLAMVAVAAFCMSTAGFW
ncbi:MAG: hypothetical protein M3P11_00855 [Actinomycetota bacterium]|nr:hypothetical protein [Actinomycetota bacterium]